jgi:Holliday junction resolvase RusA-like endonuclease
MKRRKIVNAWHTLVCRCIKMQRIGRWTASYPVDIDVTCLFGKGRRIMDADNLQATAKMSIDSLKLAGVIPDDSPRYVRSVKLTALKAQDGKTRTLLTIREAS